MKYVFHPEALSEYAEAVKYYSRQRSEIAQSFIDAVEEAIYKIRETPSRYSIWDEDVRRCFTRKFPYAILFTIETDYILILAVMHCSREPGYWQNRR